MQSQFDSLIMFDVENFEFCTERPIEEPSIKVERVSSTGPIQKRRPGRLPTRPDHDLGPVEFEQRIRRRERNRHAAARCRQRYVQKVSLLEKEVNLLTKTTVQLAQVNHTLQKELRKLQFQIKAQKSTSVRNVQIIHDDQSSGQGFTPLLVDKSFQFPILSSDALSRIRTQSFTDFDLLARTV